MDGKSELVANWPLIFLITNESLKYLDPYLKQVFRNQGTPPL